VTILDLAVCLGIRDRQNPRESHVVILDTGESAASAHDHPRQGWGAKAGAAGEAMVGLLVDAIGDAVIAISLAWNPPPPIHRYGRPLHPGRHQTMSDSSCS